MSPALPDYFALLGLSAIFDIDPQALETAYFSQQRLYHPDRFVGTAPAERQAALQRSGDINNAYQTLKNPLSRAQYLLHLQGIAVGTEADSIKPSQALLMETMEWRETIDGTQGAEEMATLDNTLETMITQSHATIANAFSASQWERMAHETLRLGYLTKARAAVALQKKRAEKAV